MTLAYLRKRESYRSKHHFCIARVESLSWYIQDYSKKLPQKDKEMVQRFLPNWHLRFVSGRLPGILAFLAKKNND